MEVRLREEGSLYRGEVLVGADGQVDVDHLDQLSQRLHELDGRLQEVLVVPVKAGQGEDVQRRSGLGGHDQGDRDV